MTRKLLILLLLGSLVPGLSRAQETVIDRGLLLRDSALLGEANRAAEVVAQLASGTEVDVYDRHGLWMYVAPANQADSPRGWLRLTSLRLSGGTVAPDAAESGSGFARLSRSLSGLLGGMRGRDTRTAHATIGIRGLTAAELQTASFDARALDAIAAVAASSTEARAFADAGGLSAREVASLEPASATTENGR